MKNIIRNGHCVTGGWHCDGFILMCKVSVIIPVYNVAEFLPCCVRSLMKQTLQDVEYIFVNDATPDESIDVLRQTLAEFPARQGMVKILEHEKNAGLPAARNTGLAVAIGEYVFHCDSDDYVEHDMLEVMYCRAVASDADIVWCDWYLSFKKNERYMSQPNYSTPVEALKAMLSGSMKYNVWNKLVRRSLYVNNDISFPSGFGMGEDLTIVRLFAHAKKVAYVPRAFYHYVKLNTKAFTQTHAMAHFNALHQNVEATVNYLTDIFGDRFEREISFLKLEAKFPFLIMAANSSFYALWKSWYPEANKFIWQNTNISVRNRTLQWLASKDQFWLIRIYYYVVIRLVYGIIFH